jgi:hypothetical protein
MGNGNGMLRDRLVDGWLQIRRSPAGPRIDAPSASRDEHRHPQGQTSAPQGSNGLLLGVITRRNSHAFCVTTTPGEVRKAEHRDRDRLR